MRRSMFYFAIIFVFGIQCVHSKLPSTIKTCSRNDPNINQCIIKAIYAVRPLLATGDLGDDYHTPPMEPLFLGNIDMARGKEFRATCSEIQARGCSNFTISKLNANTSAIAFDVDTILPKITFVGKYTLRMKILGLDIQGSGNMSGYFENVKSVIKMSGVKYEKDGVEYVRFTKMLYRIFVGNMKLRLENLFNGDKTLGEVGNSIINDNQDLFLSEVTPGLEKMLSQNFLDIANEILQKTTFDEMFPVN